MIDGDDVVVSDEGEDADVGVIDDEKGRSVEELLQDITGESGVSEAESDNVVEGDSSALYHPICCAT